MAIAAGAALTLSALPALADTPPEFATPPGHHHGRVVFPTRDQATHAAGAASGSGQLTYGGGVDSIGVTTGPPKVYLVFYGSQWGSQSTDVNGNATFSGDSKGVAPRLQQMFKGLGTNSEIWSGVMTQYCEGVSAGATTCASTDPHVGYPTGGALAGVWEDNTLLSPSRATGHQLAVEAVKAAGHFGNTTAASNRNAQYFVVSPHGTHPDGFNTWLGNFCAWHDYNGDTTLSGGAASSSYGDIAFTNMPYVTDMGTSCGANYVNAGTAGTLDGVTIVGGHEYAETVTDQNPAGGWTDSTGYENADKCAWNGVGGTGGAQNVSFATGSFAMQSTYSNDVVGCQIAHAIVTNGSPPPPTPNTVTVNNPGNQTGTVGTAVNLQITATDSGGLTPTFSATGLPAGLSISTAGLITGTPTTAATYTPTVTATDSTGGTGNTSFTWTINAAPVTPNTVTVNNPGNQTGTVGTALSLQITATDSGGLTPTFSATGLPPGLTITANGSIGGTPTTAGTYSTKVTATDSTGGTGSATFTWTVSAPTSGCTARQLLGNPGFETGTATPWVASSGVIDNSAAEPAHSGAWKAWLDGYGTTHTDTLTQTVTIPTGCTSYVMSFWLHIDTAETTTFVPYDQLSVQVVNASGSTSTLATYSNLNKNTGYVQKSFNLASYAGQKVTLRFQGSEDYSLQTSFVIDDVALNVS